jgi:hypothetical protein
MPLSLGMTQLGLFAAQPSGHGHRHSHSLRLAVAIGAYALPQAQRCRPHDHGVCATYGPPHHLDEGRTSPVSKEAGSWLGSVPWGASAEADRGVVGGLSSAGCRAGNNIGTRMRSLNTSWSRSSKDFDSGLWRLSGGFARSRWFVTIRGDDLDFSQ